MNAKPSNSDQSYLWFEQSQVLFAVPMDCLQEVMSVPLLRPLPTSEPALAGLTTLRNVILPVFNPLLFLDARSHLAGNSGVVAILKSSDGVCLGLLADRIGKVITLPALKPLPRSVQQKSVFAGIARIENLSEIFVLDVPQLAALMGAEEPNQPSDYIFR